MITQLCVSIMLLLSSSEYNAAQSLAKDGFGFVANIASCQESCFGIEDYRACKNEHYISTVTHFGGGDKQTQVITQNDLDKMKAFSQLDYIWLVDCQLPRSLTIPISSWSKLQSFDWSDGDKALPEEILRQLVQSPSIIDLECKISSKDIGLLCQMKSLKSLYLELEKQTDLTALRPLQKQLISLNLSGEIPDNLAEELSHFTNLRILYIHHMPVDRQFIAALSKLDLAILWLIDTPVSDDAIPTLEQWKTLNEICICPAYRSEGKITNKGKERLRRIPGKTIWLDEVPFARTWEYLTEAELKGAN